MRRTWWWSAACAGLMTVVVAGAATAAGAASRADDEQIAEAGVLVSTDFPAGWTSTPRDSSNDERVEEVAGKIPSCKRYLKLRATGRKQPRAESDSFELGDSDLQNTVAVFPSTSSANAAMKVVRHASIPKCMSELYTTLLETEIASDPETRDVITEVAVNIEPARISPVGDAAHLYDGTVVLTANEGTEVTFGIGLVAVRADRAVSLFSYQVDSSAVAELVGGLVAKSVGRLDTALA
jgi:hypothetical protein